jgi:diguanylate cyclase (GGDEF)-like protein
MIIPFFAYSILSSARIQRELEAQVAQRNLEKALGLAHTLDQYFIGTKNLLVSISHSEPAVNGDLERLDTFLKKIFGQYTYYSNIIYIDTNGDILVAARGLSRPRAINVRDTAYFQRAQRTQTLAIGDFMFGKISGTPVVHVCIPVSDSEGKTRAYLAAAIDMTRIQRELKRLSGTTETVVSLVDTNGILLARNVGSPLEIGKSVKDIMPRFKWMITQERGTGTVVAPDGTTRVFAFTRMSIPPWYVRVGTDSGVIAREVKARRNENFKIFLALVLVALTGWLWLGRDIEMLHLEARRLALIDPLTGLWNFRKLDLDLHSHLAKARRYGHPLSLLMIDIDNFKAFNDEHGHIAGDQVLKCIAAVISDAVRDADEVYRYGGEEFCVLMPQTSKEGAIHVAERIRESVQESCFVLDESGKECRLTVSIGIATFPEDALEIGDLIKRSDFALYDAKRSGRNRVVTY